METTSLKLIETLSKCGAGLFGLLAAVFLFIDACHTDQQEPVRSWFRAKWAAVHNSPWLALPERIVTWVVNGERAFCSFVEARLPGTPAGKIGWALACVLIPLLYWHHWGQLVGLVALCIYLPMLTPVVSGRARHFFLEDEGRGGCWLLLSVAAAGPAAFVGLQIAVGLPIYMAALVATTALLGIWIILALPVALIIATLATSMRNEGMERRTFPFAFGATLGTIATFLALALGHAASPAAWVPQTMQMLVSNLICDGFTMVATFWILAAAIAGPGFLRVPRAILLNLLAGGVLAFASLYFGLVGTRHALSLSQLAHILIARSPDGARWEIGPYFWTMHTTFLPTLILLLVILVAWLGKALLLPVHRFLGIGREHKSPLKLTAALWALIAAIFTALAGLMSLLSATPKP